MLWLTYWKYILDNIKDEKYIFTAFDNYFSNCNIEIDKVINFVNDNKVSAIGKYDKINGFIDSKQRNNDFAIANFDNYHSITIMRKQIVEWAVVSFLNEKVKPNKKISLYKKVLIFLEEKT
jgi:hypothetical protein